MGEDANATKALPEYAGRSWHIVAGLRRGVLEQGSCVWLDQTELGCSFDGRPAIIDVEFPVDALGIGANRAQADHEFAGDLWPRKLGLEQAEHVKLALAERLDQ